jgi:hypothetical protein
MPNPEEVLRAWKRNKNNIIYQPNALNEEEDFEELCRIIFKHGNTTLLVDEGTVVSNSYKNNYFMKLVRMGTNRGIGVVFISQRPSGIANSVISEASYFFIFKLILDDDKQKLKSFLGEKALQLHTLPKRHFLYYGDDVDDPIWHKPIK